MATRIRLARGGKKKRPFYRIVVADQNAPRDGRFIERIGSYDPLKGEDKVVLDIERATHWLNVGARPSETVSKLLTLQGLEHGSIVLPTPKPKQEPPKPEAPAEAPQQEEAKAEAPAETAEPDAAAAEAQAEAPAEAAEPEAVADAEPADESA